MTASTSKLTRWCLAALFILGLTGCPDDQPFVEVKGQRFEVIIADTNESRARGLMFVDEMADDEGMFFIFRRPAPRAFWMKNTRIPLDIIYLDPSLRVVDIVKDAKPCKTPRCRSYPSRRPAQYVLELNGGLSDRLGLEIGDQISVGHITLPN